MHFVRNQVRLNCDLNTAYKSLTNQSKINQWTSEAPREIICETSNHIKWSVDIPTLYEALIPSRANASQTLEFYIMSCTENTEYCTEVHLIVKFDDDEKVFLDQYSRDLLERLRFHFNKTWVIQDKDLTLSSLKRSR